MDTTINGGRPLELHGLGIGRGYHAQGLQSEGETTAQAVLRHVCGALNALACESNPDVDKARSEIIDTYNLLTS